MLHLPAVFFAVFWIWSDLIGVLLSVISTYFYFGWEGAALLVPKIFAIALLAFSAPTAYRLLLRRFDPEQLQRTLLLVLFFLYLGLAVNRQSDFFAWGAVGTAWLAGLTMMAVLRTLGRWPIWSMPLYVVVLSLFFYMATRISQAGVPLMLSSPKNLGLMGWATLGIFVLAGIFLPQRRAAEAVDTEKQPLPRFAGSLGLVFGLLTGLSVGLVTNLNLWSAQTEPMPAAAYFLPQALGALFAWQAYRRGQHLRPVLVGVSVLSLGAALLPLLYWGYDLQTGLLANFGAASGLFLLWACFLGRWRAYLRQDADYFPWLGLQGGFVALLLILAQFLLKADPSGFWLALIGSGALLLYHELKASPQELPKTALDRLWLYSGGVFGLMGLMTLPFPIQSLVAPVAPTDGPITVISSNIRYGWTDDYRFDPFEHPRWLKTRLPNIMGLQEVNHGHTSGAYSDLYRLYVKLLPGKWRYGDAHFGFGNALFSKYKIIESKVHTYKAKDMLKRSCLIATLDVQGKPVNVFVTHLSHLPPPNQVRLEQVDELVGLIKGSPYPWILLGDFNSTPDSPEIAKIKAIAHPQLSAEAKWLTGNSFPGLDPDRRIDYVFFSEAFNLKKMEILDNQGTSDHRPIYAELELKMVAGSGLPVPGLRMKPSDPKPATRNP